MIVKSVSKVFWPSDSSPDTEYSAWRPLNRPVEDMPLALCEFSSLDLADVASSHFQGGPGYVAETYVLRHNPNHKWVWFSQQHPDELLVFLNFDSRPGDGPRCELVHILRQSVSETPLT